MPSLGTKYRSGKREQIISKELHKRFQEENPSIEIDYNTFRTIIIESNKLIHDFVANSEDGFKLPAGLGYLVVTKYKSKKKAIDWKNSNRLGKHVYFTNAHSLGYISHIKWYKSYIVDFYMARIYKFEPYRLLTRMVAKNTKEGKKYHQWVNSDFWTNNKTKKLHL
jgi:hypothetical protein